MPLVEPGLPMPGPQGFGNFHMEAVYLFQGDKVKPIQKVAYPTIEIEYLEGDKIGVKEEVSVKELLPIQKS